LHPSLTFPSSSSLSLSLTRILHCHRPNLFSLTSLPVLACLPTISHLVPPSTPLPLPFLTSPLVAPLSHSPSIEDGLIACHVVAFQIVCPPPLLFISLSLSLSLSLSTVSTTSRLLFTRPLLSHRTSGPFAVSASDTLFWPRHTNLVPSNCQHASLSLSLSLILLPGDSPNHLYKSLSLSLFITRRPNLP
jgi:hypothetical protein